MILSQGLSGTAALLIHFDDGLASVYSEAFAYLQPRNMRATAYIVTDYVDSGPTYMSTAQLVEMDAAGWDIANHTSDHVPFLDNDLSQAEIEATLTTAKTFLDNAGLTRASMHVAFPFGQRDARAFAAMAATGMLTGRSTVDETFVMSSVDFSDLPAKSVDGTADSLADIQAYIDTLISQKKVGILLFHKLVATPTAAGEWAIADFRALVDYIIAQRLPTITISQLNSLRTGNISWRNTWD